MGNEVSISECAAGNAIETEVLGAHTVGLQQRGGRADDDTHRQRDDERSDHATLDTTANALKGEATIRYTNNSPDTLTFVWMQVEQNAFKPGSLNSYVFPAESRFGGRGFEGGDVIERFNEIRGAAAKGVALKTRVEGTMMKVDLSAPLAPGQTTSFDVAWHFTIPEHGADRMYEYSVPDPGTSGRNCETIASCTSS